MSQRSLIFGLILLFLVLISHASFGHTILDPNGNIPGRTTVVQKVAPCGGIARTGNNKMLTAGSSVRVDWLETIQHTGHFEIYLSTANDANFTLLKTVPDDQNGTNDLPHSFNTMVQLPAGVTCDNCTLQVIQVMLDNHPAAPTYYYACGDIQIQSAVMTTPSPLPTPGPVGTPTDTCH